MNKEKEFVDVDLVEAWKLITPGRPVLIATKGYKDGLYNLTPIGWVMPMDYEPVTQVIFSSDPSHQCVVNINRSKNFAVCIPTDLNDPIIEKCGSLSSADLDKFARFGISSQMANKIDVKIPYENICAWIECELEDIIPKSTINLVIGKAVAAKKVEG